MKTIDQKIEYDRRYKDEIEAAYSRKPSELRKKELDWIIGNPKWTIFTATVTFKNLKPIELGFGYRLATHKEYDYRVMTKIKRRLSRSRSRWNEVCPYPDLRQYEYDKGSVFKPIPKANSPHHIHGLFPVPIGISDRIYDFKNGKLDQRLRKDIASIDTVSSFLIEPLRIEEAHAWLSYMTKGKAESEIDF